MIHYSSNIVLSELNGRKLFIMQKSYESSLLFYQIVTNCLFTQNVSHTKAKVNSIAFLPLAKGERLSRDFFCQVSLFQGLRGSVQIQPHFETSLSVASYGGERNVLQPLQP